MAVAAQVRGSEGISCFGSHRDVMSLLDVSRVQVQVEDHLLGHDFQNVVEVKVEESAFQAGGRVGMKVACTMALGVGGLK